MNKIILLTAFLYFLAPQVFCQDDIPGSRDNPLIPRYTGARIIYYDQKQEDHYILPLGPLVKKETEPGSKDDQYYISQNKNLRGRIIRIHYSIKDSVAEPLIYNFYEEKLAEAEFETIISSDGRNPNEVGGKNWCYYAYASLPQDLKLNLSGSKANIERGYISAEHRKGESAVYITVMINRWSSGEVFVQLDMIDVKPESEEINVLSSQEIAGELKKNGHVALQGLRFREKQTDLLTGSEKVLAEVARFLQENRNVSLFIVGHTDTELNPETALYISKGRAESVLVVLTRRYGIPENRLSASGVGGYSPVTTNETSEGRTVNNRIELVVKPN